MLERPIDGDYTVRQMNARGFYSQLLGCVVFGTLLSGCAMLDSLNAGSSSNPTESTRYSYLEEQIKRLNERLTGLETSTANLQRDLNDVQARVSQLQSGNSGQATASELQQLRERIQTLE